ncbi:MAG: hypothetical protein QOC85_3271 [Streptomyces sp.]|nr:hypothetical protein [Streptomyces sp.]
MARARPSSRSMQSVQSMQEIIQGRRRRGFVGRQVERAAFRENLDVPPGDERHRFLFHVHGNAGVGKTFLVRELEQLARERGALTAYVDEGVGSVPEALAVICERFARQGRRFKDLERLLATHRERRHEAETAVVARDEVPAASPSAASLAAARAGLVGLGLVPGVGAFAGAVDPAQLAQGADRLRAGFGTRLRNQEDLQLVLSPERVLTPVLLAELAGAAAEVPWIVLLFDTYERTGLFLDGWLHDTMTTDRYGALPANVVVVTAGQHPFDTLRWGGFADWVRDVPLDPFTEAEARGLLADRGVVSAPVVAEVLRLTGGLPVLVSTLAETRPADPGDVGDPSATAVERFLKWEQDPVRRAAALACAFPRRLDADVFRAAVDCPDEDADALFDWLRGRPFVSDRGDRIQYHEVVRAPMLRLQRHRSPRGWAERHGRLAETFAGWRADVEVASGTGELWADERWRELRLAESYHRLCAQPWTVLPKVLRDFVDACDQGEAVAVRWAGALLEAGRDAGAQDAAWWGFELGQGLAEHGTAAALGLLLNGPPRDNRASEHQGSSATEESDHDLSPDPAGLDAPARALAHTVRGGALHRAGAYEAALAQYEAAVGLDPGLARAYRGRATSRGELGDYEGAIGDLDRAVALAPDDGRAFSLRGEYQRILRNYDAAIQDLDRGIALDPAQAFAWASRGATRLSRGELDEALVDLDRALELDPGYGWALARRARVWRARGDQTRRFADLDRAVALQPDWAWGACERGDALRSAGRHEEALADYDRALALDSAYASAYASRGASRAALGRHEEALADLDRALELRPGYAWALEQRAAIRERFAGDGGG